MIAQYGAGVCARCGQQMRQSMPRADGASWCDACWLQEYGTMEAVIDAAIRASHVLYAKYYRIAVPETQYLTDARDVRVSQTTD